MIQQRKSRIKRDDVDNVKFKPPATLVMNLKDYNKYYDQKG